MSTPPSFTERAAAELDRQADRAFAQADRARNERAEIRLLQEGRRLRAQADEYRRLAAEEQS
jgi:hypothetical protein